MSNRSSRGTKRKAGIDTSSSKRSSAPVDSYAALVLGLEKDSSHASSFMEAAVNAVFGGSTPPPSDDMFHNYCLNRLQQEQQQKQQQNQLQNQLQKQLQKELQKQQLQQNQELQQQLEREHQHQLQMEQLEQQQHQQQQHQQQQHQQQQSALVDMASMNSAPIPSNMADMTIQTMPAMTQDSGLSAVSMQASLFDMPVSVDMLNLGLSDFMVTDPTATTRTTTTADLGNFNALGSINSLDNFNNFDSLNNLNVLDGMNSMSNVDTMGNMASLDNINTDEVNLFGNAFGTQPKIAITNEMIQSVSRLSSLNLPIEDMQLSLDESGMDEVSKKWVLERALYNMSVPIILPGPEPITLSTTPPLPPTMLQSSSYNPNSGPSSSSSPSSSSNRDQTASSFMSAPFPERVPVSSVQSSGLSLAPGSISMPMFDSASMPTSFDMEPAARNSDSPAPPQQYHHHMPPPAALSLQPQDHHHHHQRMAGMSSQSPESHPIYSGHSNDGMYASSGPHNTQSSQQPAMSQPNQPVYNESPVPQYHHRQQPQFEQHQAGGFQSYPVTSTSQQHSRQVYMTQGQAPPQVPPQDSQGQHSQPQPVFTRQPTYHHHPPPTQAAYPPTAQFAQSSQVLTHQQGHDHPSPCSSVSSVPQHTQPSPPQPLPTHNSRLQTAVDNNYTHLPRQAQSSSQTSSRTSKAHRKPHSLSSGDNSACASVSSPSTPASVRDRQIPRSHNITQQTVQMSPPPVPNTSHYKSAPTLASASVPAPVSAPLPGPMHAPVSHELPVCQSAASSSASMPPPPRPRPRPTEHAQGQESRQSMQHSGHPSAQPVSQNRSPQEHHRSGWTTLMSYGSYRPPTPEPDPTRPTNDEMIATLAESGHPMSPQHQEIFRKYNGKNVKIDDVIHKKTISENGRENLDDYHLRLRSLEDFCRMRILSERLADEARAAAANKAPRTPQDTDRDSGPS